MPTITHAQARSFLTGGRIDESVSVLNQKADEFLQKTAAAIQFDDSSKFTIFLSHSYKDKAYVETAYKFLTQRYGGVYLDWKHDTSLNREKVSPRTAERLRKRMQDIPTLIYVATDHHDISRWMPWECGFKDGHNGRVAVFPFTQTAETIFQGQEYLGVYPWINSIDSAMYVMEPMSDRIIATLGDWIKMS